MISNLQVIGRRWLLVATAFAAIGAAFSAASAHAEAPPADGQARAVDQDVQALKKQLIDLNRDLFELDEQLLYPDSTQVAVFLSVDVGTFFALDSVTLKIDDKEVAHYLYTDREMQALYRGGVQRLYVGNLKSGPHEVVAFFTGKGPHDRDYRRGAALTFDKEAGTKYIELRISDRQETLQPEFVVRQWQ